VDDVFAIDFYPAAHHPLLLDEFGEQTAVAAPKVEHMSALRDDGGDDITVRANEEVNLTVGHRNSKKRHETLRAVRRL
jgi:hypothetical protein